MPRYCNQCGLRTERSTLKELAELSNQYRNLDDSQLCWELAPLIWEKTCYCDMLNAINEENNNFVKNLINPEDLMD
jgi:hypothetical protein